MKQLSCILAVLCPFFLLGQNHEELKNEVINQRIEFLAEQSENDNIDFTDITDNLSYYFDNPLNLNYATREELESLELLTPFQIQGILAYVVQYGQMVSIYELRNVRNMDKTSIYQILPFVTVSTDKQDDDLSIKDVFRYGRHEMFLRWSRLLEEQRGFAPVSEEELAENPNRRFLGSPDLFYLRYRFRFSNKVSIGLTGNKRPGEEFFTGHNPYGFDFYSAHLFVRDLGFVKQVAVGDFHAQFGQGLALWTGFGFTKTPNAMNVIKYGQKLRGYTSANENLFMRGAGVTVGSDRLSFTGFYSQKNVDANVNSAANDSLDDDNRLRFSSIQQTGLHRTPNEIANRRSITERITGGNLTFEEGTFHVGMTGVHYHYDGIFNRNLRLYNQFDIDSNEFYNGSVDLNWMVGKVNFFGEAAFSGNGGNAYIAGAQFEPDPRVEMIVANRNYSKDYHSMYAIPFGESSRPQNERGTYIGTQVKLAPRLTFNGYADFFRFDWFTFSADAPSSGVEYLSQVDLSTERDINMYVRYRYENKARNSRFDDLVIRYPVDQVRQYVRYNIKYSVTSDLQFGNRVEFSFYNHDDRETENGFLLYQDIRYNPDGLKWKFWGRMTLFDVDSWDARIYAYENDVLYFFNIPALHNRGMRYYALVKYEASDGLHFWLKFSRTHYSNAESVGSGLMEVNGSTRTDVRAQVRLKF